MGTQFRIDVFGPELSGSRTILRPVCVVTHSYIVIGADVRGARILFQRLTDMLSIQVPGEDEHCNRDELSTQMSGHSHNELTLAVRVSAVRSLA